MLTNVFVLTEGWDCPRASVCILARGAGHPGSFLQMVGRVLRTAPGKTHATLIDLRGAVYKHGMPDQERVFSLAGRAISGGQAPGKTCPECGAVVPTAKRVCSCGYEWPAVACVVKERKVTKIVQVGLERASWDEWRREAAEKGYKDGWIARKFVTKYGRFPSKYWRELRSMLAASG